MNLKRMARAGWLLTLSLALVVGLWGVLPVPVAKAASYTSTQSGNWNDPNTWGGGGTPGDGDDVTITAGHTVTVNANTASIASLTVNGTLRFDNSGIGRSMTVTGNVIINSGGVLDAATGGSATTHSLTIGGDLTNDGTFDGLPATGRIINVTFNRNGNQTVSGTGTTRFNVLTLNMGTSRDNILDVQAVISLLAGINPLVIQNGTFKLSSGSTITPFTNGTGATIPSTGGFWLNGGTVTTENLSWTLNGLLRVSAGTLTIGTLAGNSVNYNTGSVITIEGGSLSIAGRLARPTTGDQMTTYSQSGGTVTVVRVGSSSTGRAGFDIGNTGSSFTMSGGTIVIQQSTNCNPGDYLNVASTYNVTGGTLQIGNANTPSANTMRINSTVPVENLVVDGSTSGATKPTAQLLNNALTVKRNVTVQAGTTLNANNLNLTVGGNWTNDGTFTAGTATVTFNGTSEQTIGGSSATAFNNLTVNSGATVVVPAGATQPTVAGTLTNNGALKQTQTVDTDNTVFLNISTDKYYGVEIDPDTTAMGSTAVTIYGNQLCPGSNAGVARCFEIAPTSPQAATVRFYYTDAERNGWINANMKVYHWNGTAWVLEGGTYTRGGSGNGNFVQVTGVDEYSPFALGEHSPTAVELASLHAAASSGALDMMLLALGLAAALPLGLALARRQRA